MHQMRVVFRIATTIAEYVTTLASGTLQGVCFLNHQYHSMDDVRDKGLGVIVFDFFPLQIPAAGVLQKKVRFQSIW